MWKLLELCVSGVAQGMVTSGYEGSKDDALLAIQKFTKAFAIVVYLKLILLSDFQPINHQL